MLSPSYYPQLKNFEDDILLESNMEMFENEFNLENPVLDWLTTSDKDDFEFFSEVKSPIDLENDAGSPSSSESSLSESSVSVEKLSKNELNNGVIVKKKCSDKRDEAYFRETLGKRLRKPRDQHSQSGKSAFSGRPRRDVVNDDDGDEELNLNSENMQGLSKNAIAARENRIRKKKYVQGLELSVRSLGEDNHRLREKNEDLEHMVDELQNEVSYLRSVLENVDEIASLVESIRSVNNRSSNNFINQHDYSKSPSADNVSGNNVNKRKSVDNNSSLCGKRAKKGVCIHLDNGRMSLEFCPRCSGSANESWTTKSNYE